MFINLGLFAEYASSLLLLSAGYHRAAEKLLLGEPLSTEEALEMGLVNRIPLPTEVPDHVCRQWARLSQRRPSRCAKPSAIEPADQRAD